jgi:hypothetical protein
MPAPVNKQALREAVADGALGWQDLLIANYGQLCPRDMAELEILKPAPPPEEEEEG